METGEGYTGYATRQFTRGKGWTRGPGGDRIEMCFGCGQTFCGPCSHQLSERGMTTCPTCRAPFLHSGDPLCFKQLCKLVHGRSEGRHTPRAMRNLGLCYHKGDGVPKDDAKAAKYWNLAADHGFAQAHFDLAVMHYHGEGVPQDKAKAAERYKRAAVGDVTGRASWLLGEMHFTGDGVPMDIAAAVTWYQLAAESHYRLVAIPKLSQLQQCGVLPRPPVGRRVTACLLTSAAAARLNGRGGVVVAPGAAVKAGRVAVLLDGEPKPISLKIMNVRL